MQCHYNTIQALMLAVVALKQPAIELVFDIMWDERMALPSAFGTWNRF